MAGDLITLMILLEICYFAFSAAGVIRFSFRGTSGVSAEKDLECLPVVSCIITCYNEGAGVARTIQSLAEQDYPGVIEILPIIDGAAVNHGTLAAARECGCGPVIRPDRRLKVIAKWSRGGRASSLNAGLAVASGEIVMALDGDTSFDRDMVRRAVRRFQAPDMVALAGTLRVRNAGANLLTRLQALDYLVLRQFVRAGLGAFNLVNNIPGAHGIFRADFLKAIGGWDTGTAEDVDLALRIRKYSGRYPRKYMSSDPHVISQTDVPESWVDFLKQRLRWEGDPLYLYLRKHAVALRPSIMGWKNLIFAVWYGGIYQLLMPLIMLVAVIVLLMLADSSHVLRVLCLSYLLYFGSFTMIFFMNLALVSERPEQDAAQWRILLVYPVFFFLMRLWSAAAVLHSILLRSHLDSSMAPWWVLKKGKF
ncbi:MAG: glycosyl transferase family 2 [Moraxellaceae bacterium]|jgi:cellulose synthase/poly-beta-1,6-N-acetylglucosamine synthase-like glycosyltransferase|nr:glycosyl transferase family 2 [Moraxellaceae bacterium]